MGGPGSGRGADAARDKVGRYAKDGCFIATAVYGDERAPQLDVLRAFRDRKLMQTAVGRTFVVFYYRWSPPLASRIERMPRLAAALRRCLNLLVALLRDP